MARDFLGTIFGLGGRVALITGGARGIGLATARAICGAGGVAVLADRDGAEAEAAAAGLVAEGFGASAVAMDVTDAAQVAAAVAAVIARHGRLDILVSNAGNQDRRPFETFTSEGWRSIIETHVNGSFEAMKACLPYLRASGDGRVVLMSSVTAFGVKPGTPVAAYSTAKGALTAMCRAVAVEYGPQGVTVNAVAPGWVKTGFTKALHGDEAFEGFLAKQVPQGGWIDAEAVAAAVLYLVSPAARQVTGVVLPVDGGLLATL